MVKQNAPLSGDRLALLEMMLQEEGLAAEASQAIPRRQAEGAQPLSFSQKRLWVLDQMEPGNPTYNIPAAIRLFGLLDVSALQASLDAIIRRHESLRTTYTAVMGEPIQEIHDVPTLPLHIRDLSQLDAAERETEALRLVHEEADQSFDLTRDLLIRVQLLRLGPEEHIFMVTMHHIASDGWSFTVFSQELAQLYVANCRHEAAQLEPLPIQYADYAIWQQSWLEDANLSAQLAYWQQQLAGELTTLDLPTDYNRPPVRSFRGERQTRQLSLELSEAIAAMVRQEEVTRFMVLLAAFTLLMHRFSRQEDIIIGSPIAGRNRPELENLIGFFLNTLVLRTNVSENPTFRELLRRVRQVSLDAFSNQDIPFEKLLEELKIERDLSRTPVFQVFFNMLNFGNKAVDMEDIRGEFITNPEMGSKFDLTLYLYETDRRIDLALVYNADLFTAARMETMLLQYESVLQQACANPDLPIAHYTLTHPDALSVLPDPTLPLSDQWMGAVHQALTRNAHLTPEKTAVLDATDAWTYRELNQRSNQLAHYLISGGVQPQDVVAIYGQRSASLVWAVLGLMKAGGAFLILDPTYPASRLVDYLEIANPRGFVQIEGAGEPDTAVLEALDRLNCACRITLPTLQEAARKNLLADMPATEPAINTQPDDLACLSFTSGSTGIPKAVMGRHGSLTHFLPWMAETFGLDSADRFSMLSGLAHDPLQRDMFTAVWLGATICVPDPRQIGAPGWLANWLLEQQVTIANLTPAMGQVITDATINPAAANLALPSLRYTFFVGDVLTRRDVNRLTALCPNLTVVNFYGSTETQRAVSYYVVDNQAQLPASTQPKEVIPLGRGMKDVQLLLQNASGQLAGVGEIAEIHVRSPHLALGYKGDEAQTASRFLPNPYGSRMAGDRLYRTGDMGRYLPDGNVEFVHRADHQVKVRGFRVELGEIDAMLGQHTAVHQALTIASKNSHDTSTRLSSFIVLKPGQSVIEPDLRQYLRKKLPMYAVPTDILLLDALPLTPNGKVDRRALHVPDHVVHDAGANFKEARSELEAILVRIWENVLGVHPISIHDNFFEIGGHSLTAVRVFAQIERDTGLRPPLTILFQAPTIAQLAAAIESEGWTSHWTSLVPIQTNGARPPFFYVSPFLISVLSLSTLGQYLGVDQPLYGLQPQGMDGDHPIHRSVKEMASHYIHEMRSLKPEGPYLLGGHCAGSWVAFEMAQQLQAAGETVDLLVLVDSRPPNIEPPQVNRLRYMVNRGAFYWRDGRLRHAISWQLSLVYQRFVTLNVGKENSQRVAAVRKAHAEAHHNYRSGTFDGDVLFVRSSESAALKDKEWHYRWSELITGRLTPVIIPGTHAGLLVEPNVNVMAAEIRAAIDQVIE
jgi:amino acid adenylation domain-containing protein